MLGKLQPDQIEKVLAKNIVGRIGCHADDTTYVVPISYAYDGTFIYGRTKEGLKINIMRKNPHVCFEVDELKNMANWESVIAWGEFKELTEKEERSHALKHLTKRILPLISSETTHLHSLWPFLPETMESIEGVVFRIELKEKTGRFESSDGSMFDAT